MKVYCERGPVIPVKNMKAMKVEGKKRYDRKKYDVQSIISISSSMYILSESTLCYYTDMRSL